MDNPRTPISQEGLRKLQEELDQLKKVERPAIIRAVKEAKGHGDLSENAEYHAAREKQSHIETKIKYLEDKIAGSEIVTITATKSETIIFGSKVKVTDLGDGSQEEYTLVGDGEADAANGRISTSAPIGKALIGKRKNDVVVVATPGGELSLKIVDFS